MVLALEDVFKLVFAVAVGGALGAEREYRDRAAGFRTIILICLGATLFTVFSIKVGGQQDPARIAAAIVSGVGFLGAGAILRGPARVVGLTTASTIWLAAALGVGIGGGYFLLSGLGGAVALLVLAAFPRFEDWIDRQRHIRTYKVSCPAESVLFTGLGDVIRGSGLNARQSALVKTNEKVTCTWEAWGPPEGHQRLVEGLLSNPEVVELEV
jgi:putative Mg2+ transporter-C (MgtC) family protein